MLAIAALADEYTRDTPNNEYLAELWRNGLLAQLIWGRWCLKTTRPMVYRVLSWLLATLDGEIRLKDGSSSSFNCEVICAQATLRNPQHLFGEVKDGVLRLRRKTKPFRWSSPSNYAQGDDESTSFYDERAGVYMDLHEE